MYESGEHTIGEICQALGVSKNTWYYWKNNKPEFAEMLEEVESKRADNISTMAAMGLKDRLRDKKVKLYREVFTKDGKKKKLYYQQFIPADGRLIAKALETKGTFKRDYEDNADSGEEIQALLQKMVRSTFGGTGARDDEGVLGKQEAS